MLKFKSISCTISPSTPLLHFPSADNNTISFYTKSVYMAIKFPKLYAQRAPNTQCLASRRVRYDEEENEEYGHNAEMAMLEEYSIAARDEVLLVRAMVDEQEAQVLIYKGFSSCLSWETSPDPSRSVLPARAVIKSIDRIRGPVDPSNIYFLEKGLTWDHFKTRLRPN